MNFYSYINEKWITINGRHVQIDKNGHILKGLDDDLIGKHLDDVQKHFDNIDKPSTEKKSEGVQESDKNKHHLKEVTKDYYNSYKEKIKAAHKKGKAHIAAKVDFDDVIEDKGFVSTSSDETRAIGFGRSRDSTILQIHVPKGSKAMSVKELSGFAAEEEILLNKESKFRILKKVGNKLHVELIGD